MRKIILVFCAFLLNLFILNISYAENFYIKKYDVIMNVKENREVEVKEVLDVYFTNPSHGIFRTIPLKNKIQREDSTSSVENSFVTNVKASELYKKYIKNGYLVIQMGSPNFRVTGPKTYRITYTYKSGIDRLKDADEFYFNIIGVQWNTLINHVRFKIIMPKDFDKSKVGFSTGRYGAMGYNPDFLKFNITGNEITGYTTGSLNPREGITVRILLPEKYFIQNMSISFPQTISIIVVIMTLLAVGIWYKYGKEDIVIPVVNFYPPEGKNSAELEVEYSGYSTENGIMSLILYLANKGYLEIEDDVVSYTFKKLKDYDGSKSSEKTLFEAIFQNGRESVTLIELQSSFSFSLYCQAIMRSLTNLKNALFEKNTWSCGKVLIFFLSILSILTSIVFTLGNYSFYLLFQYSFLFLFPVIAILVFALAISIPQNKKNIGFITLWSLMFGGIPLAIIISSAENLEGNYPLLILEIVCLVITIICLVNMPKRNRKGRERLGQILGFKKYLETVEKGRLQQLINENPTYCEDILPFAFALGIMDSWLNNLEGLNIQTPKWYKGENFTYRSLRRFSNDLSNASNTIGSSLSSSRSGSGHSGGGRSGGGHGGGGGGSW